MSFSLTIKAEWNMIQTIKASISGDAMLISQSKDFREQTVLAAIELLENAMKYSDSDATNMIRFRFAVSATECELETTSYSKNSMTKQVLSKVVDSINNSANPYELYVKRLEKLMEDPDGFSRLGLYRIAYEAEFRIDAEIEGESVRVRAIRPLEKAS